MDKTGLHMEKFEKRWPTFFQIYEMSQCIDASKCRLHSWKIILSCYVATILQMQDSWYVNLAFRANN